MQTFRAITDVTAALDTQCNLTSKQKSSSLALQGQLLATITIFRALGCGWQVFCERAQFQCQKIHSKDLTCVADLTANSTFKKFNETNFFVPSRSDYCFADQRTRPCARSDQD